CHRQLCCLKLHRCCLSYAAFVEDGKRPKNASDGPCPQEKDMDEKLNAECLSIHPLPYGDLLVVARHPGCCPEHRTPARSAQFPGVLDRARGVERRRAPE